jgi:hypothetical protein
VSPEVSERSFEEAIECALLQYGPDACAGEAKGLREPMGLPYGDAASPPRSPDAVRSTCSVTG